MTPWRTAARNVMSVGATTLRTTTMDERSDSMSTSSCTARSDLHRNPHPRKSPLFSSPWRHRLDNALSPSFVFQLQGSPPPPTPAPATLPTGRRQPIFSPSLPGGRSSSPARATERWTRRPSNPRCHRLALRSWGGEELGGGAVHGVAAAALAVEPSVTLSPSSSPSPRGAQRWARTPVGRSSSSMTGSSSSLIPSGQEGFKYNNANISIDATTTKHLHDFEVLLASPSKGHKLSSLISFVGILGRALEKLWGTCVLLVPAIRISFVLLFNSP
ncbi:uncharacterized protein LOC123405249 [Hordeum vulgare subsp. vulgare]|uniref:uncharacterized protein LOC123405249 n=1 Tax=Hordeum vulgare subsp. vulgare TaxID=112509 RepID=UPI001D1A51F2|nr:uncharacterized protein LOC123405249 [Hordeum vulgare subsp. vulgare]